MMNFLTDCIYLFPHDSEKYSINQLSFVMAIACVFFEVRSVSLINIRTSHVLRFEQYFVLSFLVGFGFKLLILSNTRRLKSLVQ